MSSVRALHVHLLPELVPVGDLGGSVAVVIDVLRASTSIIHALASGATCVRPCEHIEEAQALAAGLPAGRVLLAGERDGLPLPGFDLGNSPRKFTPQVCRDRELVLTTSNGTRALLRAARASRVLIAGLVNYSAVCEQLIQDPRPVRIICSGTQGDITLEDTLLAGAFVDCLADRQEVRLNDGARVAWDCFEAHGRFLNAALKLSAGGQQLCKLDFEDDIRDAGDVDSLNLVPELKRDPLRVEVGSIGFTTGYWRT